MLINMPSIKGVLENKTTIPFKHTAKTDHIAFNKETLMYNTLKLTAGR